MGFVSSEMLSLLSEIKTFTHLWPKLLSHLEMLSSSYTINKKTFKKMFMGIFTNYHVSNVIYKHILHSLTYLIKLSFFKSSTCRKNFAVIFSFMTCHRVYNQINTTGATSGAGTVHPSGAPEFTLGFQLGSCYSIFGFMCMFCTLLFVHLYFSFGHCVVCPSFDHCVVCPSSIYGF